MLLNVRENQPSRYLSLTSCIYLALGRAAGRSEKGIIYGGGNQGLMGAVATSALEADAPVIGKFDALWAKFRRNI